MNIGETIRNFRLDRGMSQGDIEKRTGLLRCYLSRVENGHTIPSLDTLAKIAGEEEAVWARRRGRGEKPQIGNAEVLRLSTTMCVNGFAARAA